jgi:hypothetical protein
MGLPLDHFEVSPAEIVVFAAYPTTASVVQSAPYAGWMSPIRAAKQRNVSTARQVFEKQLAILPPRSEMEICAERFASARNFIQSCCGIPQLSAALNVGKLPSAISSQNACASFSYAVQKLLSQGE